MFFAKNTTEILQQLRLIMAMAGILQNPLKAYIVPSGDAHHSLRMADCDQRRAFVTGFDGSSGVAVITLDEALLWTDARYFIQADEQMDENWTLMKDGIDIPMEEWLIHNMDSGSYVGLDPKYYGKVEWDALKMVLENSNLTLTHLNYTNLIDEVWSDRPDCPNDPVSELSIEFSGKSVQTKIQEIYEEMDRERVEVLVITELDEIAWLLNLRGTDLPLAPVFNAYAILIRSTEQLEVFIDSVKISQEIKHNLSSELGGNVNWYSYDEIYDRVQHYVKSELGKIWISKYCNAYLGSLIPEDVSVMKLTPISLLKAVKNDVEVNGMKQAHLRDSSSIVAFLAWLEEFMESEDGIISEIDAANMLTSIKSTQENYVSQSFKTISATGSNAAIVHYFPTEETNTNLSINEMYLLDSGSHYYDGTTDITRSLHFGTPTDFEIECYTRVLKGHISVATAKFPYKTTGRMLDSFAREFLWQVGLDYGHGTGHGIGAYLNVGEGPHSAGIKYNVDDPGLRENMFMSNEPGYYEKDKFGIRLENIVRVINSEKYAEFLELDTISYVPFQQKLIDTCLLTDAEVDWINDYHAKCFQFVGDYITNPYNNYVNVSNVMTWLEEQTKPIDLIVL
ncbi:hypothetical protein HA402_015987 [Bradysia odoriphaga]|nr:hypothetical protein HA402_015987 [Bradysia odoriphaga]